MRSPGSKSKQASFFNEWRDVARSKNNLFELFSLKWSSRAPQGGLRGFLERLRGPGRSWADMWPKRERESRMWPKPKRESRYVALDRLDPKDPKDRSEAQSRFVYRYTEFDEESEAEVKNTKFYQPEGEKLENQTPKTLETNDRNMFYL